VGKRSGRIAALALTGVFAVAPAAYAQEGASIRSQCQREAQDYGIEPEQFNDYVTGCVQAYGGVPEVAPEPEATPPAGMPDDDSDATAPVGTGSDTGDYGEPDSGAGGE
jgi:hypothetical protein